MTTKPRFITFTGVDEDTNVDGMLELSAKYPIEWGILFSPSRQGTGRYPSLDFIRGLVWVHRTMDFAAHLCGGHSRSLMTGGFTEVDDLVQGYFRRAQINAVDPDRVAVARWAKRLGVKTILQCRSGFPEDLSVSWLYDASGGRGIEPAEWPAVPQKYSSLMVGYAGGLRPDNVARHIERINLVASDYWIDMESGVHDERDSFDLAKCRAVCEAVYGTA